jgi:hypothetical protein
MLQEDERRTKDGMSQLMHHIVNNDYTNLKGALTRGGMQICTGMCANFTVQLKTDSGGVRFFNFFAIIARTRHALQPVKLRVAPSTPLLLFPIPHTTPLIFERGGPQAEAHRKLSPSIHSLQMISINVHDANALHYAICRSSFAAASAILVAAPGLANKKCSWRQTIEHGETGEMSVHSEVRSPSVVNLLVLVLLLLNPHTLMVYKP